MASYSTLVLILVCYIISIISIGRSEVDLEVPEPIEEVVCLNQDKHTIKKMDELCRNCHTVLRDLKHIYDLCRKNCFGSSNFYLCLRILKESTDAHLNRVKDLHNGVTHNITWTRF